MLNTYLLNELIFKILFLLLIDSNLLSFMFWKNSTELSEYEEYFLIMMSASDTFTLPQCLFSQMWLWFSGSPEHST